ncbi:MAG: hypothetical protein ACKV2Q_28665 [Planctomycetaceae bacterium]
MTPFAWYRIGRIHWLVLGLASVLLSVLAGCQNSSTVAPPAASSSDDAGSHSGSAAPPKATVSQTSALPNEGSVSKSTLKKLSEHIHFKDADGHRVFELKPEPNGAKLVGPDEKEITRYHVKDHTLKIKDADDVVLGHIVRVDDHYKVEDAERKTVLFKLAAQSDGDWTVENGKQERLYRIKKRDYGFEIELPNDESFAKAKLKEGKRSLRNAQDATLYSTKDHASTLGLACLGLEKIESMPIRLGLLLQMTIDNRP